MSAATLSYVDGDYHLQSPFSMKDDIKSFYPSDARRWNPQLSVWVIDALFVDAFVAHLEKRGHAVGVEHPESYYERKAREEEARKERERHRQEQHKQQSRSQKTTRSWADDMFQALPGRLHEPAYKALLRVFHPDVGGDLDATKMLNNARDRAKERSA